MLGFRAAARALLVMGVSVCADISRPPVDAVGIAVLPFVDLTGSHTDDESIADRFARLLTDDLDAIADWHVAPTATTFLFKEKPLSAPTLAGRLRVRYLVEGSIRRINAADGHLAVRLVRAQDGVVIQDATYDGPLRLPASGLTRVAAAETERLRQALDIDRRR